MVLSNFFDTLIRLYFGFTSLRPHCSSAYLIVNVIVIVIVIVIVLLLLLLLLYVPVGALE